MTKEQELRLKKAGEDWRAGRITKMAYVQIYLECKEPSMQKQTEGAKLF